MKLEQHETDRLRIVIQRLITIRKRADDVATMRHDRDLLMRQLDPIPGDVVVECRKMSALLERRGIAAPELLKFARDPHHLPLKKVILELRQIEDTYGTDE